VGSSTNASEFTWTPLIFQQQEQQQSAGDNINNETVNLNNDIVRVENVRVVQEVIDNGQRFFLKAPVLLEPSGPVRYMPCQTPNRNTQMNKNNQLAIVSTQINVPSIQEVGSTSQIANNGELGNMPKKRLRLEGEIENTNDSAGDIQMQERVDPKATKEADDTIYVHDNPLFSVDNVKAGPARQACLKK
jgi:hypothetical protein